MMAAAITRMLKLELVKRTSDGGVCVADTSGSGATRYHSLAKRLCGRVNLFRDSKPQDLWIGSLRISRLSKRHARDGAVKLSFLRVLRFSRVFHTAIGGDRAGTALWRDRLLPMGKEFFGTDGIRGVPGTPPLDDDTLYATGRSLGEYLKREHGAAHVLIGMDTRESGPHISSLLAAGLKQAGGSGGFSRGVPTPGGGLLGGGEDFSTPGGISAPAKTLVE